MLRKIISGGQTGADQGGLRAAEYLRLETGGVAAKGFKTEDGYQEDYLKSFGLVDLGLDYSERTIQNVQDSDGTVVFGRITSPGSKLTLREAVEWGKPCLTNPTQDQLALFVVHENIEVLNVAGNRESKSPGIGDKVAHIVTAAFIGRSDLLQVVGI